MSRIIFFTFLFLCTASCSGAKENPWNPDWNTPGTEEEIIEDEPASLDRWTDVSASFGELPSYIRIYSSPETLKGKPAVAYIAVADMDSAVWDVWSVVSDRSAETPDQFRTPAQVYGDASWPVVINGGFFYHADGKNYTSSLAVRESEVLAYNINYASEDWVTMYYPTRAAFLQSEDGDFDACWTYVTWDSHFMYPAPAPNSWADSPAGQPSDSFPEGASEFAAKTAIGGGPVLINDGEFTDSYREELFDGTSGIGPDASHPRTAIGVTDDGKMIFFVCEGREMTEGVAGLTTADVADVLLDLGCVEAMNLDGGGSSCMLVNGKETIKVSDGSQRAVASTVMMR
ncbi:MAG: phosphodiester glycosidase family protein [Bacteroidales bacterium]|nr:phosphodiester glycosidase family protein [Bacteroidales bacterium]MBQ8811383.1 phosphodiester glycosidase family protein [Bacteroidales bacterium]